MADPVVTVTPTVMSGTVVRWHRDLLAAENNSPVLSASRDGVRVHDAYLNTIPAAWVANATEVYEHLAAAGDADLSHLATHRRSGLSGPLEPITKENADA